MDPETQLTDVDETSTMTRSTTDLNITAPISIARETGPDVLPNARLRQQEEQQQQVGASC